MDKAAKDPFVTLLNKFLEDEQITTVDDVIYEAVGEYIFQLFETGFIPDNQLQNTEDILREEAAIYLKKKMYGYLSLEEFRLSLKKNTH